MDPKDYEFRDLFNLAQESYGFRQIIDQQRALSPRQSSSSHIEPSPPRTPVLTQWPVLPAPHSSPNTQPQYLPWIMSPRRSPSQLVPTEELPLGDDWNIGPTDWREGLQDFQIKALKSDYIKDVKIITHLGRGQWGAVYEVEALYFVRQLNHWKQFTFGMKVIRHKNPTLSGILSSFSDYNILRNLRFENICNMAEMCGIPDRLTGYPFALVCVFLEICSGSLSSLVREAEGSGFGKLIKGQWFLNDRWVLPPDFTRHWFAQIARAVDYIHGQGVAHNDILMQNIFYLLGNYRTDTFVDRFFSSTFKLGDFGNAIIEKLAEPSVTQKRRFCSDIKSLYNLFYTIGVPLTQMYQGTLQTGLKKFAQKCRSGQMTQPLDDWINADMIDLIGKMGTETNRASALDIMKHKWVQSYTDNRTEPFIWKPGNQWHKVWDNTTQKWV